MGEYKPLKSFKNKKDREQYVIEKMLSEGLQVIEGYKGNATPMKCLILNGEYKEYVATIRWNNFTRGKRPDFRSLLNKEHFLKDKFKEEGYKVVNVPENVRVTDKISVISPEGNKWSVSYDTFKTGVRCPLDSTKSWGERCVGSILKQNNIPFNTQYTILHEDRSKQYMDFYIEYRGEKFNVEYNGRQHYEEDPDNRIFASLRKQQAADDKKKQYCRENDIVYVEIPYTTSKVNDIAVELHKYFPCIDLSKNYIVENFNIYKEMAEYYMTHSERDTALKFGVSGATVRKNAYKLGCKKDTKHKSKGGIE
jgi:hypothetical protein